MFASIVDGTRHLRGPLIVGYSILLTGWLLLGDRVEIPRDSDGYALMRDLVVQLGSAGRISLITVAAYFVGNVVLNLYPRAYRLGSTETVDRLRRTANEFRLRTFETPAIAVPAERYAAESERHADEFTTRGLLVVWAVPPILAYWSRSDWKPLWLVLVLAVPILDYFLMRRGSYVDDGNSKQALAAMQQEYEARQTQREYEAQISDAHDQEPPSGE